MKGISSVVYPRSTVLSLRGKFQYTLSLFASVNRCLLQSAHRASLARCSTASQVQARCTSLPMPAEPSPRYLRDHCMPVYSVTFRQRLRSASSHQLVVPCYRLSTYGRRAFSVAARCSGTRCRTTYEALNSARTLSDNIWRRFHCTTISAFSALQVVTRMRYINPHLSLTLVFETPSEQRFPR